MKIALFDLDHTLVPFDSGTLFVRFLIEQRVLDAAFEQRYLDYCRQYVSGTLDMRAMHRFTVGTLAKYSPGQVAAWLEAFSREIASDIPPESAALVGAHRAAGHRSALVTATTRFIAQVFGAALGFAPGDVIATVPAVDSAGRVTGEIVGEPCFREHKLQHVDAWLAGVSMRLEDAERSWFYSDSTNDLALLEAVTDPVVVAPDASLAALAAVRGWRRHAEVPAFEPSRSPIGRFRR